MRRVLVRSDRCIGCRSCEIACIRHHLGEGNDDPHSRSLTVPRIKLDCRFLDRTHAPLGGPEDNCSLANLRKIQVVLCQHCEDPECVSACTVGALTKDEDGMVRHHPELCIGCLTCIKACPFEAIYQDPAGRTVVKCDLCGGKETPSCVEACIVEALYLETESGEGK